MIDRLAILRFVQGYERIRPYVFRFLLSSQAVLIFPIVGACSTPATSFPIRPRMAGCGGFLSRPGCM